MGRHRGGIYITKPMDPGKFRKYTCMCGCGVDFYDYSCYHEQYKDKPVFLNREHHHRWLANDRQPILLSVKAKKQIKMEPGNTKVTEKDYRNIIEFWAVYHFASWFDKYVKWYKKARTFRIVPKEISAYNKKVLKTKYLPKTCVCCGENFYLRASDQRCFTEDFIISMNVHHKARYMANNLTTVPLDLIDRETLNMHVNNGFWEFNQRFVTDDDEKESN